MDVIEKYFTGISPHQKDQFLQLGPLYEYWNENINVISRRDINNLYLHHILHSLSIGRIFQFLPGTTIIDAGTGGGFPGIPLAILFPECRFLLVDSIAKKVKVVSGIANEIKLSNCDIRHTRLENLSDRAEFVVCRAVKELPRLMKWVNKNILPGGSNEFKNGLLALKGGDLTEEIKTIRNEVKVYHLKEYFVEDFFETKKLVHVAKSHDNA